MKKIALLAAGAAAAFGLAASAAQAATIDTTGFWNGSSSISAFGGDATGVYGETFTSPGSAITDFTVYVNTGSDLDVVAQVYAWSGSLIGGNGPQGATGPALFTSDPFTISGGDGFQAITVDTGSTPLTFGHNYVLLLADVNANDEGEASWGDLGHPGVAGDGGFNFYNNDYTLASINANTWDSFADFGSLAYKADFTGGGGVPEPASWALMLMGFGGLGLALRASRRRQTAAGCA